MTCVAAQVDGLVYKKEKKTLSKKRRKKEIVK